MFEEFINQRRIKEELIVLLNEIREGANFNILLRAPSGYGKTHIALEFLSEFKMDTIIYPALENIGTFITTKRFHFLDEAHTMRGFEKLYSFMDSGNYTIVFATNLSGTLPEALINRCINLIFEDYSFDNIKEILRKNLDIDLNGELLTFLAKKVRDNPRIAKRMAKRLSLFAKNYGIPKTIEELKILLNKLGVFEDGLTILDIKYLEFLESVGTSSLERIQRATGIDKDTIINEIEPFLIKRKLITITSKGRSLL